MDKKEFIQEHFQVSHVNEEMLMRFDEVINELSPRETMIMRLKLDKGYNEEMIAKEYGLSYKRVSDIVETIYLKLKHPARRRRIVGNYYYRVI